MKHALILTLLLGVTLIAAAQSLSPLDPSQVPFRVGNGVSAPTAIYNPNPRYTRRARKAHIQGDVVFSVVVRADGTVGEVDVLRSLDKELDENAIATIKRWRYNPGQKNGDPVAVLVYLEVHFRLDGDGKSTASRPQPMSAPAAPLASAPVTTVPGTQAGFPDSKIETMSDGLQLLTNAPIGARIALPAGWSQISYTEGANLRPAFMVLNLSHTLAFVDVMRQTLEASPDVYKKTLRSGIERAFQNTDIVGEQAINKSGWNGVRLLVLGTQKDIKMRCIVDVYTRESRHHVVEACAPDEVFAKYRMDFDAMLKSVEFTELAPAPIEKNK